jgi:lipoprotein-anchoring transpeptidase ErfK/SrfK
MTRPQSPERAAMRRIYLKRRLAVGIPFGLVVVLAINIVVAVVGSPVRSSDTSISKAKLAALLLPGSGAGQGSLTYRVAPSVTSANTAHAALESAADHAATAQPRSVKHGEAYRDAPAEDLDLVPSSQVVAHLEGSTPGYPSRDALGQNRTVPGTWYGYPSILPVVAETRDRLKVRLAQRPDEAETWIARSSAVLTTTHWAILVDIGEHWLYVFHDGIQQAAFPVGNGASNTPTPTGTYFLAFHAPPNGPGYGSVMLETSAHSKVIEHFEGGDDAIIAIHGPVGSDSEIGTQGAAISNGCIRMHDWDLNQVKHVPNGAPIILTD